MLLSHSLFRLILHYQDRASSKRLKIPKFCLFNIQTQLGFHPQTQMLEQQQKQHQQHLFTNFYRIRVQKKVPYRKILFSSF